MPLTLRRLIGSILLAVVMAGSQHATIAAAPPVYVVCVLPDASELMILAENFDGVGKAVLQCTKFWKGSFVGLLR